MARNTFTDPDALQRELRRTGRNIEDDMGDFRREQARGLAVEAEALAGRGRGVHNVMANAISYGGQGDEAYVQIDPRGLPLSSGADASDVLWGAEYGSREYSQFRRYRKAGYQLAGAVNRQVRSGDMDKAESRQLRKALRS